MAHGVWGPLWYRLHLEGYGPVAKLANIEYTKSHNIKNSLQLIRQDTISTISRFLPKEHQWGTPIAFYRKRRRTSTT